MERREFLKLLFIGVGVAAAAAPAEAFTSLAPLAEPDRHPDLAPRPAVATSEDLDAVEVQKAYYHYRRYYGHGYYRRGPYYRHRRRVYRRHARRVYRRYRRGYYY